jgi:methylmalonyl-CoA mutase
VANDELTLGADFPAASRADWLALVDKVLDGAPFDRKLVTTTYDGLRLQPLYTRGDGPGPDAAGRPGAPPHLRGRTAAANVVEGWDVRQYHAGTDPAAVNRAVLTDLERGVTSIVLGPCGAADLDALDRALEGVYLDVAPICLDWGPDAARGADLLAALWDRRGLPAAAALGELGLDPLGTLARHGRLAGTVDDELADLGRRAADCARNRPAVVPVRVDATVYGDAGGSDAFEVAAALATGVAYLRAMTDAGLGVDDALARISFRLNAGADQFATMAKLRAARRCWARVAEASGAGPDSTGMTLHAVTAKAMYSRRDPWVNLLRATLACFAAAAAGADAITVLPFGAAAGQWDELGVRLARNTQIILAEESGVHRVADPGGGSWYVETRSEELAAEAWRRFQDLEGAGGMAAALVSGRVGDEVDRAWDARLANLARRRDALTGVSEFPDLDERGLDVVGSLDATPGTGAGTSMAPLPLRRYAAPFEDLRDRADRLAAGPEGRPTVFLANLGPIATHTARATFAKNFFEVGGIRTLGNDGFAGPDEAAAGFAASGSTRAVICSSDKVYGELAEATARALKAAGCATVYLAGNPGDARAAYQAAGIDEFVHVGSDLLDILGRALGA